MVALLAIGSYLYRTSILSTNNNKIVMQTPEGWYFIATLFEYYKIPHTRIVNIENQNIHIEYYYNNTDQN